jgi:mannitol-specific phosphotransferase system IIBC component
MSIQSFSLLLSSRLDLGVFTRLNLNFVRSCGRILLFFYATNPTKGSIGSFLAVNLEFYCQVLRDFNLFQKVQK